MRDGRSPDRDALRFNELWQAHADRVLAYATRHVGPDAAQEVVAETFLVAWRRLADLPGAELPWLLVVARNTVANHRRSAYRRSLLHTELAYLQETAAPSQAADVTVTDRAQTLTALAQLSDKEREALLLVTWDGLTAADAARVAGCTVSAFHVRLFRARRRFRDAADDNAGVVALTDPAASRPGLHAHGLRDARTAMTGAITKAPLPVPPIAHPLATDSRMPR